MPALATSTRALASATPSSRALVRPSRARVVTMAKRVDVARVDKTDAEWRSQLNPMEFQVLRKKGTEPARTGEYDKFYPSEGHFVCRGCGTPLYSAQAKFNSGCGWPAFDKCYAGAVKTEIDNSFGMRRIEIMCAACDGHLGHVFENEGFTPTMERHCVNSISVRYVPEKEDAEEAKVVEGGVASTALGFARSPIVLLIGLYVLSDLLGRVMNFWASRQG